MQFFKDLWEIPKKFLSKGDSNLGPLTWNLTEGNLGINPEIGSEDADQMGIIMNGANDILLRSGSAEIDVPMQSLIIDGNSVNSLAAISASTLVTPLRVFTPSTNKYLIMSTYLLEFISCYKEDNESIYNQEVKYTHDVFDYDEFSPS